MARGRPPAPAGPTAAPPGPVPASRVHELEARLAGRDREMAAVQARLQALLRHVPAAVAFKDPQGRLLQLNPRAEALMGHWVEATPKGSRELLFPPETVARSQEEDARGLQRGLEVRVEETLLLPDGRTKDFQVRKFPVTTGDGSAVGVGVLATDLAEHRLADKAYLRRQKLEAAGLLAGGLAHDFNNLLGAMIGNLELLQMELGTQPAAQPCLENLEGLASRAALLVDQLLSFAGKGGAQVRTLDLNRQVEETTRVLRASLSARAALRWQPEPGLPPFRGDPGQVQRVVSNLVFNAVEAMDGQDGLVTVRTGLRELGAEELARDFPGQGLAPGPHLLLEVEDQGRGMDPGMQERVFEPFFTTKSTGRGLGLSAVQGILRSHEGGVRIQSQEGRGTTVQVLFPAAPVPGAQAPAELAEGTPEPLAELPAAADFHASGRVLVVDDEPMVRAVAAGALRRMGFEVLEARDGREALEQARASLEPVRLVLLDYIMPEMDGAETYRELRQSGFRAPVILTSGFGRSEAVRRFQGKGLAGFLPKPYRYQTLVETVRRALEREADGRRFPAREPVAWCPDLESGLELLDAGHQALLEGYNRLAAAAGRDGGEGLQDLLGELDRIRQAHHAFEESLMARASFPERLAHRTAHQRQASELERLRRQLGNKEVDFTPALLDFIEGLIFCHEEGEDRTLISFLRGEGRHPEEN